MVIILFGVFEEFILYREVAMRTRIVGSLALTLTGVILATLALPGGRVRAQQASPHPLVTPAEYLRWQTELSNWGRWGKDDELGTLNLITPAKRKQALALAKEGFQYLWPAMRAPPRRWITLAPLSGR